MPSLAEELTLKLEQASAPLSHSTRGYSNVHLKFCAVGLHKRQCTHCCALPEPYIREDDSPGANYHVATEGNRSTPDASKPSGYGWVGHGVAGKIVRAAENRHTCRQIAKIIEKDSAVADDGAETRDMNVASDANPAGSG